jgi:hypothetical protein
VTPPIFFAFEYQKYAGLNADLKSVEIIGKSALRKSYSPKTFALFFCYNFFSKYFAFFSTLWVWSFCSGDPGVIMSVCLAA